MPRSSWKGFIKLSLVSVPVKGYTASSASGAQVRLNQLHADCHSRIKYQKTCPIHGEVAQNEIVMGYEYAKDQYVVIDTDEVNKLRSESDRSVSISEFVPPEQLDARYFSGQTYYLTPDGPAGQKPYALLHKAMVEENVYGLAQVVLSGKEQLVVLRPIDNLLAVSVLHYEAEVKQPAAFEDELVAGDLSKEEVELAKKLVEATTKDTVDLAKFKDLYTQRLTELIEAKVAGKEIVAAPAEEGPAVINLMDALRASVSQAQASAPAKAEPKKKAAKKMAASTRQRKTPRKTKKTG